MAYKDRNIIIAYVARTRCSDAKYQRILSRISGVIGTIAESDGMTVEGYVGDNCDAARVNANRMMQTGKISATLSTTRMRNRR